MKAQGYVIREFGLQRHLYADDTQFYLSVSSDSKEVVETLNLGLEGVTSWMSTKKLKLNTDKTWMLLVACGLVLQIVVHQCWTRLHSIGWYLSTI